MPGVEKKGVGSTGEWRMLALLVNAVALLDDVAFALIAAALGADLGIGVEVKFIGCLREDDGADVTSLHDQRSLPGKMLLLSDEKLADFGNLSDEGNAFVNLAFTDVRERVEAGNAENEFAVVEAGFDSGGLDCPRDGFSIPERDSSLLEIPGDAAIHGASIDVDVTEAPGELA